jgi:ribosomal protein S27AE
MLNVFAFCPGVCHDEECAAPRLTWRTDEPCPLCGAGLFLLEGLDSVHAECRLCGYTLPLTYGDLDGGDW